MTDFATFSHFTNFIIFVSTSDNVRHSSCVCLFIIYDILSSIETSALGTTSREFILQYAEVRLFSLQKSKTIEEATVQTCEISEKVQALISRNEELNDRLERQASYIGKLQRELSTFKSVNKNIKIVSLVLLFLLIGQVIAHFTL